MYVIMSTAMYLDKYVHKFCQQCQFIIAQLYDLKLHRCGTKLGPMLVGGGINQSMC